METTQKPKTADLNELVTSYFHDKKYRLFREFCFKFNIKTLAEITPEYLDEFSKQLGVGKTKSARVHTIFQNNFPLDEEMHTQKSAQPLEAKLPTSLTITQIQEVNLGIQEAFSESHFKMIVNFCRANGVLLVSDLDLDVLRRIRTLSGMGPKKYRYMFERLESLHDHLSKVRFEIEPQIYAQIQLQNVADLITKFGLSGAEEYANLTVEQLHGRTAREVVTIGNSHNVMLLNRYLKNPETTITTAIEQLNEYEHKILKMRHEEGATLEALSEQFGMTVERLEQVEKRIYSRLWATLDNHQFFPLLAALDNGAERVSETYLAQHLPEHKDLIITLLNK